MSPREIPKAIRERSNIGNSLGSPSGGGARMILAVAIHEVADVGGKLSGRARDAFAMRYLVERVLELGMRIDVFAYLFQRLAGLSKDAFKLGASLGFGFRKGHLYAAVSIDLAFP